MRTLQGSAAARLKCGWIFI